MSTKFTTADSRPAPGGGVRALIDALAQDSETAVLGIVVETEGSTYRKPGALLLRGVDRPVGFLSGGCLEPELDLACRDVQRVQRPRWLAFNTRGDDDLLFGSASGCRGLMRLLLLPLPRSHVLRIALATFDRGSLPLNLCVQRDAGGTVSVGATHWEWKGLLAPEDCLQAPALPSELRIPAPPQVLLAGCGPEAPALIAQLRALGARVSVIEHRGLWSMHARGADLHLDASPQRAWEGLRPDTFTAALVMGHHYGNDLAHLRQLARSDVTFVGLLGPPARRDALLAELGPEADRLRSRLHAPVGLRLGGEGPESIALAIAAQLQMHFTGVLP